VTAEAFIARGASVLIVDIDAKRLEKTAAEFGAAGAKVQAYVADISDRNQCFAAVEAAVSAFGGLDVLCNAAAVLGFHLVPNVTASEWERIMGVNVAGAFYLSQAAIPHLLKTHGNIVNVTSQSGVLGSAYIVPYAVSKAALTHLTKSLALEYIKSPIRINAVTAGTMRTEISAGLTWPADADNELRARYTGIRPRGDPADVAAVIVFVASDAAKAVHGAEVRADQGASAG
jgi:NAD(P)-dependent dehydrogenase (short-subunit alcohol dehydrogenase family)